MRKIVALLILTALCFTALAGCTKEGMEDVNVKLVETTLLRENPNNQFGDSGYPFDTPVTDAELKESTNSYADYVANQGNKVTPGFLRKKAVYVENLSNDPVYVRIVAVFPAAFCKQDDPVMEIYTSQKGEADPQKGFKLNKTYNDSGNCVITFTFHNPVEPGALTYWPSLEGFGIPQTVPSDRIAEAFAQLNGTPFDVSVSADAINAKGYDSADEAFADFDKKHK